MKIPVGIKTIMAEQRGPAECTLFVDVNNLYLLAKLHQAPGTLLYLVDAVDLREEPDSAAKPPPQVIAPAGAAATSFPAAGDNLPPLAKDAARLARNPQFQGYVILANRADPAQIKDAHQYALAWLLARCGARAPADFADERVVKVFNDLVAEFDRTTGTP